MKEISYFRQHPRGAILVEVLLAFLVFLVGITGSVGLIIHSTQANTFNKNRIIATNLAREGLEVVKNIRDTNWLIYSANMRACWNSSPDTQEDGDMANNTPCAPDANGQNDHAMGENAAGERLRAFLADFDAAQFRWMLLPSPQYFDGTRTPPGFFAYDVGHKNGEADSVPSVANRTPQLWLTPGGRYTHSPAGNTATLFYRDIEIYYIDNPDPGQDELLPKASDPAFGDPSEATWRDNRIRVVSKVYWKNNPSETAFRQLSLETILTDYLNRTNWTD